MVTCCKLSSDICDLSFEQQPHFIKINPLLNFHKFQWKFIKFVQQALPKSEMSLWELYESMIWLDFLKNEINTGENKWIETYDIY